MGEVLFVLKSFVITCVVVYCLQFKIGNQTADQKLNQFLQNGTLTNFLKDASEGATRLTASTYNSVKDGKLKVPLLDKIDEAENVKKTFEEQEQKMRDAAEAIEDQ